MPTTCKVLHILNINIIDPSPLASKSGMNSEQPLAESLCKGCRKMQFLCPGLYSLARLVIFQTLIVTKEVLGRREESRCRVFFAQGRVELCFSCKRRSNGEFYHFLVFCGG